MEVQFQRGGIFRGEISVEWFHHRVYWAKTEKYALWINLEYFNLKKKNWLDDKTQLDMLEIL